MPYPPIVLDLYQNSPRAGGFQSDDPLVGTGMAGTPECGQVIRIQVRLSSDGGRIEGARFKTFGCGYAIAVSALAAARAEGLSLEEAERLDLSGLRQELELPPHKGHLPSLAAEALRGAVAECQKKVRSANLSGCEKSAPPVKD
ncbi:iron-sulfur cluster assembly scaffold protein [Candidatus Sumerlaeota bacterium]|nr:iron-sulfur cluster assembly scaffold protein [Candidatus Sumerlaeota bacterium]